MTFSDSRTIFNAVAESYDAYRPHYPPESLLFIVTLGELDRTSTMVDIGSGTGRLALALAPYVRLLYAVDTAQAMLDRLLENARAEGLSNIHPIGAPGEQTGLAAQSLDLAVLSQSFHWMDKTRALKEMHRILKPGKPIVLLWNRVIPSTEPFADQLQDLIKRYNPSYSGGEEIESSDFGPVIQESNLYEKPEVYTFRSQQEYTADTYVGYLLSKSYIGAGIPPEQLASFMTEAFEIVASSMQGSHVIEEFETILLSARTKS